jgi:plastocyanin
MRKSIWAVVAIMGLWFTAIGVHNAARATTAVKVQGNPTITIKPSASPPYTYEPAEVKAKVGQAITVTNNDENGVHSVTAQDGSFNVDVPPKGSATVTVSKAGSFPYYCTYHSDEHNKASITAS